MAANGIRTHARTNHRDILWHTGIAAILKRRTALTTLCWLIQAR